MFIFTSTPPNDNATNGEETPGILLRNIGEPLVLIALEEKGLLVNNSLHLILLLHSKTEDAEDVNENLTH